MGETPNGSRYPQINVNTGMSVAVVVILGGFVFYFAGIKSDQGYQSERLNLVEAAVKELRTTADATRFQQAQSETKWEVRLTRIEIMLQDVLNRLAMADRDRRGERKQQGGSNAAAR